MDPQAAPAAVKTANGALAGLTVGQVWTQTAPRGEQQIQATLVFQGKEVAWLEFDPATNALQARGQHAPPPPPEQVPPANAPMPPPPDDAPVAPPANTPTTTAHLAAIKAKLPGMVKSLSVGQGAEIMPLEGFWRVPLISENRVVGELHLSGDGAKVMQDFAASRDAAIYAR